MKRILHFLWALLFLAAPALAQSETLEGDWQLASAVVGGVAYEDLTALHLSGTMRLEVDGTGVQTVNGEACPCKWRETDGGILIDDGSGVALLFTLQPDGTLAWKDASGDGLTFARVAAVDSAAGTWALATAIHDGVTANGMAALELDLRLQLDEGGTGMLLSNEAQAPCTWSQNGAAVAVAEEGGLWNCTLRPDGMLSMNANGITLILRRVEPDLRPSPSANPLPEFEESGNTQPAQSESSAIVSEYGYSVRLPEGWIPLNDETVAQMIASIGEELASTNGFSQDQLDQLAALHASLYCLPDGSASFNVVRESADGVTMETFPSLASAYQELYRKVGVTDFVLSGPVDIHDKSYYVGTFTMQDGIEQKQYFCAKHGYIFTITFTNVSPEDSEWILSHFEIL